MSDSNSQNQYAKFNADAVLPKGKTYKAHFQVLLQKVQDGEYGEQVKFTVFGIGDFDPSYDLTPERIREIINSMKFYAKF